MYRKEKPITLKGSTSSLCNNLSVLSTPEKGSLNYAVVHKAVVNIVSCSTDGSTSTNRQIVCKEPSASQQSTAMIMQAKWVVLPSRTIFVLTSLRGIQMFESDGSAMLYWHALGDMNSSDSADQINFGRGITGVGDNLVCVGTQRGIIIVFTIPVKGTMVTLKETLKGHKTAICDLASQGNCLVSSDDEGNILVWNLKSQFEKAAHIPGSGSPCSSLALWNDIIVAGYGNGQMKIYSAVTGRIGACVNAHARWVNAVHVAADTGLLLSVSDDSFVRVWKLKQGTVPGIEFKFSDCVNDLQLVGAQFVHASGRGYCVSGYDNSELTFFVQNL